MNFIQRNIDKIDNFQQSHRLFAFPYAVIKKYGEDQGGYLAALLTYYIFLSLFPLLLIVTTLAQWALRGDSHLKTRIITGLTGYFPIVGSQLQQDVHGFSRTGLPLIAGLLVLLYGARGVADVFRHIVNAVWRVPLSERSGFLPALLRSTAIIFIGGIGFIGAALIASYATLAGRSYLLRLPFILTSMLVLYGSFIVLIRLAISRQAKTPRNVRYGAGTAAFGLVFLQSLGGYIVTHELKHLNTLYGTFAVVLGLFFWLYLQAQLVVYALEINTVKAKKLWPRSLTESNPNEKSI